MDAPDDVLASQSSLRKGVLLFLFCLAQFLDTFNTSSLFSAIPDIAAAVGYDNSHSVWLNSAYQLTFAAFLLVRADGRYIQPKFAYPYLVTSSQYSTCYAEYVFLAGAIPLFVLPLIIGFLRNKIAITVLRALSGIGASLTIPSSLHLLVHLFPDPAAQARAISAFSGSGAIGNVLGVVFGAIFVSFATWPWVFWCSTIIAFLISVACAILIPNSARDMKEKARSRSLDLVGVSILTISLVLFIFAVSSGSVSGWATAGVLAPLIISVFLFGAFFVWEARIPEHHAALPPKLWFYPNFGLLAGIALLPYTWWSSVYLLFAWLWQEVYRWSAIMGAVHFLPIGLAAFPFMAASGILPQKMPLKWILVMGLTLMLIGTVLLPFANTEHKYWPFTFPAFIIGTAGTTLVFATTNIAIFAATPSEYAGVVGAVFNCALQLGTAIGSAAITSIQTSVEKTHGGPSGYAGRAAGFWFLFAVVGVEMAATLVFFRKTERVSQNEADVMELVGSEHQSLKGPASESQMLPLADLSP